MIVKSKQHHLVTGSHLLEALVALMIVVVIVTVFVGLVNLSH